MPQLAMSAATMIACASESILMGKHSFLGPVDPQFLLHTPLGQRMVPADTIVEQFELAVKECADPNKYKVWIPMLTQFGPDLLKQCQNAGTLSRTLTKTWLHDYMFRDDPEKDKKSSDISDWLSKHKDFLTHSRHLPRQKLKEKGMKIENLEDNQDMQDAVLSLYHATMLTFANAPCAKIIENHQNKRFVKTVAQGAPIEIPMRAPNRR